MITLITGLPGNGKTLYALTWLKEKAEKEGRTVYYSGITDCMIPGWVEADPEKWMELPKGSIILIDEVQRVMRPRQHGTTVPPFVAALETHRHLGVDLVLITQHPMLLDSNVRRLVGQHMHVIRKFGTHWATIHEWNACKEQCDKNRADSIRHEWRFPKETFALYKSAEVHTHKASIPKKVWLLLSIPFIVGGLGWYTWANKLSPDARAPKPIVNAFTGETAGSAPARASGGGGAAGGRLTTAEYIRQHVPRVEDLAYTAPVYDGVTQPVVAPYPAACVASATRCQCYTQQGTRLQMRASLCQDIAAGGFFVAWSQPQPPTGQPVNQPPPQYQASPSVDGYVFRSSPVRLAGTDPAPHRSLGSGPSGSILGRE